MFIEFYYILIATKKYDVKSGMVDICMFNFPKEKIKNQIVANKSLI